MALKKSGYNSNLKYINQNKQKSTNKTSRNTIWFNPPFTQTVKTNVAKKFFHLLDKHFPKAHLLHKVFNRNTVKVSYSCMKKSNEFLFFECLGQFDSHEPFFSFKHQFFKFCNLFVPDFKNLHNLIHVNDVSDTKTMFDDSSISNSENSKNCEGTPFSNVQGNEAEMCDGRLKGKFVSKNVINLSKRNLSENEISLLSKGLNFIPTCNKVDVARF